MTLYAVPIGQREAFAFVRAFHRHNKPPAGSILLVGVSDGAQLWGVAIAGRPVARRLDDGETLEVTRVCVKDGAPRGCCSFLYARCARAAVALGWRKLITYTLGSEPGASLRGAGWKVVAESRLWPEGKGWPSRPGREWQAVHGQQRIRWEAELEQKKGPPISQAAGQMAGPQGGGAAQADLTLAGGVK